MGRGSEDSRALGIRGQYRELEPQSHAYDHDGDNFIFTFNPFERVRSNPAVIEISDD
jgi:hypothetical protein